METRTVEEIWEDVGQPGPELAGKRVRLTVLDEMHPKAATLDEAIAPTIKAAEALAAMLPPLEPVARLEDWGEEVTLPSLCDLDSDRVARVRTLMEQ
jgi:hypothetical protein